LIKRCLKLLELPAHQKHYNFHEEIEEPDNRFPWALSCTWKNISPNHNVLGPRRFLSSIGINNLYYNSLFFISNIFNFLKTFSDYLTPLSPLLTKEEGRRQSGRGDRCFRQIFTFCN